MERFCTVMGSAAIVGIALLCAPKSTALEQTWINHPDIRFEMLQQLAPGEERPKTVGGNGNQDCYMREVVTRPSRIQSYPINYSEIRQTVCGQDTAYGFISQSSGLYMRTGTEVAGQFAQGRNWLLDGPNLSSGVITNADGNVFIVTNMVDNLMTTKNDLGEVIHVLSPSAKSIQVKTANGSPISIAFDTVSFSNNGRWMLADLPGYGTMRVDTETGEMLSFGVPVPYYNGTHPGYQTAISSDGRYAILMGGSFITFRIYDLESCSGQSRDYPRLKECPYRDLQSLFLSKVNYGAAPYQIRFTSKSEITFYSATNDKNGLRVWRQYRMTMGDVPRFNFEYLGLGDSFASGEGSGQYKPATDDIGANMCHTSMISYPLLAGLQLGKEKYDTIACSGAVIDDVYLAQDNKYKGQAQDGLTQDKRDINSLIASFLPGKITQFRFVDEIDPELITISIGGNDIGFGDKIRSCIIGALPDTTCFDTYESRLEAAKEIETQIPRLEQAYKTLAANGRKVYVLGYPKIIDPNGNCADNVRLDNSEADFADKLVVILNSGIKTAAKRAGVAYVDVENILVGHRLCETDSDDVYVHGLTAGDEKGVGPARFMSASSFHPKKEAQPLYRDALLAQTDNLTKPMPKPDSRASFTVPPPGDRYWQAEHNGRSTFIPKLIHSIPSVIMRDSSVPISVDDADAWLNPNADVTIELHSTPIKLGTFKTDTKGNLAAIITVPGSVPPGYHSLHIYGKNVAGQPVDLYKYLYVLASGDDADGDGVLNQNDPCNFIDPIGQDEDRDGIDDACDIDISTPAIRIGLPSDIPPDQLEDSKVFLDESVAGNEVLSFPLVTTLQNAESIPLTSATDLLTTVISTLDSGVASEASQPPYVLGVATAAPGNTLAPITLAHGPVPHPRLTKNWLTLTTAAIVIFLPVSFVLVRSRNR